MKEYLILHVFRTSPPFKENALTVLKIFISSGAYNGAVPQKSCSAQHTLLETFFFCCLEELNPARENLLAF